MKKKIFFFLSGGIGSFIRLVPIMEILKDRYELAYSAIDDVTKKMDALGYRLMAIPWVTGQDQTLLPAKTTHWYDAGDYWAALGYKDKKWVKKLWMAYFERVKEFDPDLIVGDYCIEMNVVSKLLGVPLVAMTQSCYHPSVKGGRLRWWEDIPEDKPSIVPEVNEVLGELNLPKIRRFEDLFVGEITVIPSFPEFEELEQTASNPPHYVGPILWNESLEIDNNPSQKIDRRRKGPIIFLYTGRMKDFVGESGLFLLKTATEFLSDIEATVVISHGGVLVPHHGAEDFPDYLDGYSIPENMQLVDWIPLSEAYGMSSLVIHHAGHGSCMATFEYGTPALVIPTHSEREYNARALEKLGVGRMILPDDLNKENLLHTINELLINSSYRKKAQYWKNELKRRDYGGAKRVANLIEELI